MRQVAHPYRSAVLDRRWPAPRTLVEALKALRGVGPVTKGRATQVLVSQGLLPTDFGVESLLSIARSLGMEGLPELAGDHLVQSINGRVIHPDTLRRVLREASHGLGIVHIDACVLGLRAEGVDCGRDELIAWLRDDPKVRTVGPDYVHVESGRPSALVESSLRQLAVTDPLSVDDLRDGVA